MKKHIIFFLVLIITVMLNNSVLAQDNKVKDDITVKIEQEKSKKENDFYNKLNLSEEQRIMAKKIRLQGHEELKPYMQKLKMKQIELNMYMHNERNFTNIFEINKLKTEIKNLDKKIHEIRYNNMKQFENILTKEQRCILEDIKKEGRNKYRQKHTMQPLKVLQNRFSF